MSLLELERAVDQAEEKARAAALELANAKRALRLELAKYVPIEIVVAPRPRSAQRAR